MRCTTCDTSNLADARFCTGCGAALTAAVTTQLPAAAALRPTPAPLPAPAPSSPPVPSAPLAFNPTINVTVQAPAAAPAPDGLVGAANFHLSETELAGIESFFVHHLLERAAGQ